MRWASLHDTTTMQYNDVQMKQSRTTSRLMKLTMQHVTTKLRTVKEVVDPCQLAAAVILRVKPFELQQQDVTYSTPHSLYLPHYNNLS